MVVAESDTELSDLEEVERHHQVEAGVPRLDVCWVLVATNAWGQRWCSQIQHEKEGGRSEPTQCQWAIREWWHGWRRGSRANQWPSKGHRYTNLKLSNTVLSLFNTVSTFWTSALQEYDRFKSFSNALLSRTSKLSELIADLETHAEMAQKGPETSEGVRVKKSEPKFYREYSSMYTSYRMNNSIPKKSFFIVVFLQYSLPCLCLQGPSKTWKRRLKCWKRSTNVVRLWKLMLAGFPRQIPNQHNRFLALVFHCFVIHHLHSALQSLEITYHLLKNTSMHVGSQFMISATWCDEKKTHYLTLQADPEGWCPNPEDYQSAPWSNHRSPWLSSGFGSSLLRSRKNCPTSFRCSKVTTSEHAAKTLACNMDQPKCLYNTKLIGSHVLGANIMWYHVVAHHAFRTLIRNLKKLIEQWSEGNVSAFSGFHGADMQWKGHAVSMPCFGAKAWLKHQGQSHKIWYNQRGYLQLRTCASIYRARDCWDGVRSWKQQALRRLTLFGSFTNPYQTLFKYWCILAVYEHSFPIGSPISLQLFMYKFSLTSQATSFSRKWPSWLAMVSAPQWLMGLTQFPRISFNAAHQQSKT